MTLPAQEALEPEARFLLDRFGDHVVGLLKYGSMAFGKPHSRSVHDFWVIVNDLASFHRANEPFYRDRLNVASTAEEQIAANRVAPNFYAIEEDGLRLKIAVVSEEDFARFCRSRMMFVKGRMQKPLRALRTTPRIEVSIAAARDEGARHAVNLCPRRFTMDQFLYCLCGLSYRAEIRPERKRAKVRSIIEAGRTELEAIYRPLLAAMPFIASGGNGYTDTRPAEEKRMAHRKTVGYLRRCKWSSTTLRLIWRNYRTHSAPLRYMWHKLLGEVEKAWSRYRERATGAHRPRP